MSGGELCGDVGGVTRKGEPCQLPAVQGGRCSWHREKVADVDRTVSRPQDWGKAVLAAHFWLIADEIRASAESAGVGERTMQRWVKSPWWPDACREASGRWIEHLTVKAQRTLMQAISGGDADKALKVLERLMPELRPPTQDVRVGVYGAIQQLPPDEVSRLLALPEEERQAELRRMLEPKGALPSGTGG